MLSELELRAWMENLAPSNTERRRIIIDLIRHKGEDHMSGDDATDCQKALALLEAESVPERAGPKRIEIPAESLLEH